MKHNLEKKFSTFDLALVLALIAVLLINILVSRSLPAPGMRKASKNAVTVTGTAPGKVGDVTVEVTADKDNIYSLAVTEQNETPGIGSLAVEQLPAAIVGANSLAVDSVSSATVTSEAIKTAAAAALESAGFDPAAFGYVAPEPEPEVEIAAPVAAEDGKVTATGKGTGIDGDVVVEIVADANTIYEVNILQQNETPGIGSVAVEKLPAAIVEANSIAVDGISGATVTSTAIKTAITEALSSAGFDPANFGAGEAAPAAEPAPAETAAPAAAEEAAPAEIPEGASTAQAQANGIDGPIVVEVTADADKIYAINILSQNETPGIGSVAVEKLPGAIVEANSTDIDGITGATVSSTAIKTAVAEALEAIRSGAPAEEPAPVEEAAPAEPAAAEEPAPKAELPAPVVGEDGKVTAYGRSLGKVGDVTVEVVADENTIYSVTVTEQNETAGIGSRAVEEIPAAIVAANSVDVDAVSGATITTDAIRAAVAWALRDTPFGKTEAAPVEQAPVEEAPVEPGEPVRSVGRSVGKNGDVVVEVLADRCTIYEVNVLEHNETQGVGSVAVDRIPAAIVAANSIDVDAVTGATVTTDAIRAAVAKALRDAPFGQAAEEAAPAAEEAPIGSAVLESTVDGKNGPIVVDVVVENGVITKVEVRQHSEIQGVGSVAVDWMPGRIVEANSVDVDGVTGATITSDAIKTAVRRALELAQSGEAAPAGPVTASVTVDGKNGPIVVEVTADGDTITDVKVLEHSETQGVGSVAVDWMPGRIVEANSVDVDGVTGATITSDAIKTAVAEALGKAA